MSTPLARYRRDLAAGTIQPDPAQERAVLHLEDLHRRLLARAARSKPNLLHRLWRREPPAPERGLYLWGGVGRGKTYLMDTFFECLPFREKLRAHFHRFMRHVHEELIRQRGEKNPLERVAEVLAGDVRVLCFDEFFVSDIGDAMILGQLLGHLFERGVTLVATSNIPPRELYRDGLQRARFLPAIDLIERHCQVVEVDGATDWRLRALERAEVYHHPLGEAAERALADAFARLAPTAEEVREGGALEIEGRILPVRKVAEDVVWFDFETLCGGPRSQNDYLEIAREFHAVVLSGVPVLTAARDDAARRFVNLVDVLYDRGVKLILSAAAPVEALYRGTRLAFEFERTQSRLLEMQSQAYLARAHRP
ncbi:MAG: cell division protein ZapE [Porticoccaceae bacterium]|nr:MAG: cell division protein ZapE [Porticoccaceae bacterium]